MAGSFGSSGSGDEEIISGINVTPLVDVVLVLLVIFLMTAPVIYQSAIKVQLPKAKSGEATQKSQLRFSLSREGEVAWGDDKLTWEALGKKLATLGPESGQETAWISADEATSHGLVVKLMDALRTAGITKFALNVQSENVSEDSAGANK